MMPRLRMKFTLFIMFCLSSTALAGGFSLTELSASAVGRAGSGEAAIGDDASIIASNPAGMALLRKPQAPSLFHPIWKKQDWLN